MVEVCKQCDHKNQRISPWFWHIDRLYSLQRGGYPFERNDLSLEEWRDIGTLAALLKAEQEQNLMMALAGGRNGG